MNYRPWLLDLESPVLVTSLIAVPRFQWVCFVCVFFFQYDEIEGDEEDESKFSDENFDDRESEKNEESEDSLDKLSSSYDLSKNRLHDSLHETEDIPSPDSLPQSTKGTPTF